MNETFFLRERERLTADDGVFGQHGTLLGVVTVRVVHTLAVLTERLVDRTAVGLGDSPGQRLVRSHTLPVGAAKILQLVVPCCFIEARIYRRQHLGKYDVNISVSYIFKNNIGSYIIYHSYITRYIFEMYV